MWSVFQNDRALLLRLGRVVGDSPSYRADIPYGGGKDSEVDREGVAPLSRSPPSRLVLGAR
jgi:hypothetical protein